MADRSTARRPAAGPRPGQPVRGSATGRPLMAALDLFGRRWTLRIIWELHGGHLGFRELQARCDSMSSSVLRDRLRDLTEALLVEQGDDSRYSLTSLGNDAYVSLRPLVRWSDTWSKALSS